MITFWIVFMGFWDTEKPRMWFRPIEAEYCEGLRPIIERETRAAGYTVVASGCGSLGE